MNGIMRLVALVLIIFIGLQLAACTSETTKAAKIEPAKLEAIDGSDFKRVILTEKAAERLDIQTASVREEQINGANRKVVPYASVIYGTHGETWLYTKIAPLTFVRAAITVDFIEDDRAILIDGPFVGTEVVRVGVAELFGTETGVSK